MMAVAWLLSALTAVQPYAQITETTVSPLRKIIDCRGGGSGGGALACGTAVPNRTTFKDFCGLANTKNKTRLSGIVLDIVLIPSEDETLFLSDAAGNTYLGGIVGEVLTQIAMEGEFEFNAIVVDPPAFDEGEVDEDNYPDWTAWALDWTNRADLVAAWFHDNRERRAKGLTYPFNFYQLSPMLVVREQKNEPPTNIEEEYFQFMMPFTWELWGAILAMFVVVTLALGFIEGKLFIVPGHLRRTNGRAMKSASLGYNLKAWLTEFFLASMAFCQAGGWWGMSQAKTASGRFLSLFTEFGILIILSAYLGNITNLMLREQHDLTSRSATSFDDVINRRTNICYRERTALGDLMRNLGVVDLGQLVDVGEIGGGFSNHTTYGAELMRSGECDAMVLPEWFAENTLVMKGPNTPCDLRLVRKKIRTVTGGWVAASPYHRLTALTKTSPAATMSDVGCMDVCHHEPIFQPILSPLPPPHLLDPTHVSLCPAPQLVEETLGVLMLDYLSEEVESVRLRQKARIKEQEVSRCDFDGYPSTVAVSTGARRRLSREAEATHPQTGSRRRRRQLKGKPASTVASATVNADGSSADEEETADDLKLHLRHFYGFFGLMALLLVFTLLTAPRLDWMFNRMSKKVKARVEGTKLAKRISLQRSSTISTLQNMGEDNKALGSITDFGLAFVHANERFVKSVSEELEELNGELDKDHLDEGGGSTARIEVDAQKEALSDIMAILQSLQASVQKIEAEQARRPCDRRACSESTPRSSEGKSLILRPQSGHPQAGQSGVRKRRSTGKESSPPKSGLETALEAGVVLDSASSPAPSTWRLPYGLRAPGSRGSSSHGSSGTGVPQAMTKLKSSMRKRRSASPGPSTQADEEAPNPNTQAVEPAPNTQAGDNPGSA